LLLNENQEGKENVMLNYELLKEKMRKEKLDAAAAISPDNVLYSTGSLIITQKLIRPRLGIALLPIETDPVFIVCEIEESLARAESWIKDIRSYIEFKDSPIDFLVDVIREKKLDNANIGIEKDYLAIEYYERLHNRLPNVKFTDCQPIFEELRMIKDKEEIELLSFAAKATRKAIDAAFLATKEGDTEKDLANRIRSNLFDMGAEEITFLVMGVGKRSSIAHPFPGDFKLKKGEIVRLDVGALWRGYNSDVARTASIGPPSKQLKSVYKRHMGIYRQVIHSMTVEKRFCDPFNLCKELYESEGLNFTFPHIGHNMGIGLHEHPMVSPEDKKPLEENMIINLEPFYRSPDGYGYHVEDLLLIHRDGPKVLTGSDLSDEMPVIE
jgi:Xaa-Pro aminopeptidase